jgi:hypothetical protein
VAGYNTLTHQKKKFFRYKNTFLNEKYDISDKTKRKNRTVITITTKGEKEKRKNIYR